MRDGLMATNQAVFAEFSRNTGANDRFIFVLWAAAKTREAIRTLHAEPRIAMARWGAMSREQRRSVLLEYLKSLPDVAMVHLA